MSTIDPCTQDLLDFVDASPTPWHAAAEAARRLEAAGWSRLLEADDGWPLQAGSKGYVLREGGSIIAWRMGRRPPRESGFRIIGAHTDSPNLRLKPKPDRSKHGYATLSIQTYGGVLRATWADRDLSLAGRVTVRRDERSLDFETRLVRIDRPLCRIPNVAIHLNRAVNDKGLVFNPQTQMAALWALSDGGGGAPDEGRLRRFLAKELGIDDKRILHFDICMYDTQPSTVSGLDRDFVHAPRLDNLASCQSALRAMIDSDGERDCGAIIALFDHEEVGSRSAGGAAGSFLHDVLVRLAGSAGELARAAGSSFMVSADMAHGVHPNYGDLHDPENKPMLNGGPVIKTHCEQRYAGSPEAAALFRALTRDRGIPQQEFVIRADLRCGSTIGPIVSSNLGIRTVDVGCAMLSMHSIREMAGARDPAWMAEVMGIFLGHPSAP